MKKTTHALLGELENRSAQIKSMNLPASIANDPLCGKLVNLANRDVDLDRMANAIDALVQNAGLSVSTTEAMVRNLVYERHFYGSYCELGAYDWLDRNGAAFQAQVSLTSQQVLNPNGCTVDGCFRDCDVYFDIKAFGFQAYVTEVFQRVLEQQLPGLTVTIDGSMDVDVKDIDTYGFSQISMLVTNLQAGGHHTIPQLNWKVYAKLTQPPVSMSVQTINPYRLAKENRYYPLKTAGQFTQRKPFMLIFTYAAQFNTALSLNFSNSTDTTLRALARRVFMQLTTDTTLASQYDRKVGPSVTVADATKNLSSLMFINLDKEDDAWLFLNPRATHPLTKDCIEQIFDFNIPNTLGIDDFEHDDY
jgi:hypothetical protein